VIHDKFIVIDFNSDHPVVVTGSSNLAAGGETNNGDNLLLIRDPDVAAAFAVEAIRLVDHFQFRAAMENATSAQPLTLQHGGGKPPWWQSSYDPNDVHDRIRTVLGQASPARAARGRRAAA
jgi:phosphatidylserine/phosphatidylglycerophosphate/cardiolipin synthase-like enzyme